MRLFDRSDFLIRVTFEGEVQVDFLRPMVIIVEIKVEYFRKIKVTFYDLGGTFPDRRPNFFRITMILCFRGVAFLRGQSKFFDADLFDLANFS